MAASSFFVFDYPTFYQFELKVIYFSFFYFYLPDGCSFGGQSLASLAILLTLGLVTGGSFFFFFFFFCVKSTSSNVAS